MTHSMRSKEEAHDYRYFPDPDLVPIETRSRATSLACARDAELPSRGSNATPTSYGLDVKQATQLIDNLALAAVFRRCV